MSRLDRYSAIIPQWSEFLRVVGTKSPPTIRARTGRIAPKALRLRLEARGFRFEQVPGLPDHLKVVEAPHSVAQTPEHWLGMFYVQQAATGVAAVALAPEPGERILDLCAAPGGKTTHISDLMDDRGCLVAVDVSENRLRALLGNVYRTGHSNILVVAADGGRLPEGALFDKVLVDAPCSAEGTLRKKKGFLRPQKPGFVADVTRRQQRLLRRAIELTRPGGVILYSTCTFAPEENEGVLSAVLKDAPVEVEPLEMESPHAPGVTSFEGVDFDPRVELAARVYPHHLDSGGLFLAKLRKLDDGTAGDLNRGWAPVPEAFPGEPTPDDGSGHGERIRAALDTLVNRLGFSAEELASYGWIMRGENVWAHRCGEWPIESWAPGRWRTITVGLRGLSPGPSGWLKPTNDLLRALDHMAPNMRVDPSDAEWNALLARKSIPVEGLNGIRALTLEGRIAGRGVVKDGELRHEIPKAQAKFLSEAFAAR
jgi:tRNA (cytosine49-C5)-methyltransferase